VAYMLNVSQPALRGVQACFAMVEAAEAEAAGAQSEAEEAEAETDAEAPDAGAATHRLRDGARSDARSGARYDWVVRARFDLAAFAPLPPLVSLSKASVVVPLTRSGAKARSCLSKAVPDSWHVLFFLFFFSG